MIDTDIQINLFSIELLHIRSTPRLCSFKAYSLTLCGIVIWLYSRFPLKIPIGWFMVQTQWERWESFCVVFLCPQSQGNNSKNSVVSSSSTKDSSMSSSAPMVPHLYLVSLTLLFMASFHCFHLFNVQFCLLLIFLLHPMLSKIFSVLGPLSRPSSSASLLLF